MKTKRPVNLDLTTIRFPLTAIASILHRISGIILFLFIPLWLWVFQSSLATSMQFAAIHDFLTLPLVKFVLWGFFVALIYHLFAGIRHLIMDMGIGETLQGGKFGAQLVMWLSVLFAVLVGVWLW